MGGPHTHQREEPRAPGLEHEWKGQSSPGGPRHSLSDSNSFPGPRAVCPTRAGQAGPSPIPRWAGSQRGRQGRVQPRHALANGAPATRPLLPGPVTGEQRPWMESGTRAAKTAGREGRARCEGGEGTWGSEMCLPRWQMCLRLTSDHSRPGQIWSSQTRSQLARPRALCPSSRATAV